MSSCGQRASTFALARSEKATTATAVRTTDVSCAQAKSTLHEDALLFAGGDAPGRFCSVHQRRRVSRSTNSTNNVLKTTPGVRSAVLLKACLHNERSTLREKKAIHVGLRKSPHERRLLRIHHQCRRQNPADLGLQDAYQDKRIKYVNYRQSIRQST
uniref:Secreted protein n=1 Tax=Mesocestoides corti TaxID=53468 RepID=A0A5K3FPY1_MESCO